LTQAGLFYPQQAHDTKERLVELHRNATIGTPYAPRGLTARIR
jgi:hypothetical protein